MAKVKITGHASGTGILTVTAPNTSTDRTITLPDATATLATNENFTSTGIDDNADATSITIDSSEGVGIKNTASDSMYYKGLAVGDGGASDQGINIYSSAWGALAFADSTSGDGRYEGSVSYNHSTNSLYLATNHATALQITSDGRGLSSFTARCWIRMDGTGTIAIDDSHNVSSIGDYGTGEYTINFANNMSNTTYPIFANGRENNKSVQPVFGDVTTSSFRVKSFDADTATVQDQDRISAIVFGD